MRKIIFLLLVTVVLQSCALTPTTNPPEPTSTIFITYTPIDTPTTTLTPRPTATATIIRIPTQNFNATSTPVPIFIGNNTATVVIIVTPTTNKPGPGFVKVSVSPTKIYWGGCEANQAVITAEVEDPDNVNGVIIFMRVKSATDEDYTPWTSGNVMLNNRDGTFTYIAIGSEIQGHNHYKDSFVYFQLVAVDNKGKEIGRTKIYEKAFSMSPCPCLTPVTGCPLHFTFFRTGDCIMCLADIFSQCDSRSDCHKHGYINAPTYVYACPSNPNIYFHPNIERRPHQHCHTAGDLYCLSE
jgi:hypothetical protein